MPMTTTFCRSRVRFLPLLAVLAVASSLLPTRRAMDAAVAKPALAVVKGAASEVGGKLSSSIDKKLREFDEMIDHTKEVSGFVNDHHDDIKEQLQRLTPGGRGNSLPGAVGYVVDTGNQRFSVSGIDIDSPVTRTGRCDVGARGVVRRPVIRPATLFYGLTPMSGLSLYACSVTGGPSTGGAVLGLGRTGTLARTLGTFSYVLSGRQADAVWLGGGTAQQGQGGTPTRLIANPVHPDRYYVQITSIQVGGLPLQIPPGALDIRRSDGSGGVYLSSTLRIGMVLNGQVYELLKAALQNSLGAPAADSRWLCYSVRGTRKVPSLPTITLVFANNAAMALQPGPRGSVWYPRKDGAQCLAVVPSPTGETILGTMAQMGRLVTYKLAADGVLGTVTF